MADRRIVAFAEGPMTRLGQLILAGEVIDDEPIMPSTLRVLDAYVLSVLIDGEGNYRDADGRDERSGARTQEVSRRGSGDRGGEPLAGPRLRNSHGGWGQRPRCP